MSYKLVALPNPSVDISDIYSARKIVDKALGGGYFSEHLDVITCAWMCLHKGSIVGWAATSSEGDVGVLKCVVVDAEHRGKGIGQRFTDVRLKFLEGQGHEVVKSYAWIRVDGSCPSCKTLERNGFTATEELEGFYANYNHKCPSCKDECKCVARVYEKRL